jgi:sugar (pentulose or hexulose) kinase
MGSRLWVLEKTQLPDPKPQTQDAKPKTPNFMAYDPNLPANNAPVVSQELRGQFAGLKTLIDAKLDLSAVQDAIALNSANNVDTFSTLNLTISNPPTQAQVQAILNAFNSLIQALQH